MKADVTDEHTSMLLSPETWLSIGGAFLGVFSAAIMYTRYVDRFRTPIAFLKKAFYVDECYEILFVKPLKAVSKFIDYVLEPKIFDGFIRFMSRTTEQIAVWLQQFQSGQLRSYIAWMAIGMSLLVLYFV